MSNNEDNVQVSVCVITYNHEEYIKACLESILSQEVDFIYELIIADDFSTDGTRDIIDCFEKQYPNIIRKIYHDKNIGVCANYNSAHYAALGKYVAHCDGDDFWYMGKLKRQVDVLEKNPKAVQCWNFANIVNDIGEIENIFPSNFARFLYPRIIKVEDIVSSYALVGQHSTQMYRKSARKINNEENFLDYWIAFNLSLSGESIYLKDILSAYRVTSQPSVTRNSNSKKAAVDYLALHLVTIANEYPEYASKAKSNLTARLLFSKIKGHDLNVSRKQFKQMDEYPINYAYFIKSCFWFLVQKIF